MATVARYGTALGIGFCAFLATATPTGAQCDTVDPTFSSFSFAPDSIDTTASAKSVTCTFEVTDALSGLDEVRCEFQSPSFQYLLNCSASVPATGSHHAGSYNCTVAIPRYAEPGDWSVIVTATDGVGNDSSLFPPSLLAVTSDPDTLPPALVALSLTPVAITVSDLTRTVTCQMTVTDAKSGVGTATCVLSGPAGEQVQRCTSTTPSSGTRNNGVFSCDVALPRYSDAGTWTSRVALEDQVGNAVYTAEAATVMVISIPEDVTHPSLVAFDFNPKVVDTGTGSKTVTCEMTLADSPAGTDYAICAFKYTDVATGEMYEHRCTSAGPTSGTRNNGTFRCNVFMPRYAPGGSWTSEVIFIDLAANSSIVSSALLLDVACSGAEEETTCRFDSKTTLAWSPVAGATRYNLYRGTLTGLTDVNADHLPDGGYGTCQNAMDPILTDLVFVDPEVPTTSQRGFHYLVGYTAAGLQKGVGFNNFGLARTPPPCP